jgi:predicted nucleic acid-binding protein
MADHSPSRADEQVRSRLPLPLYAPATTAVPVVIDTNVALDWLVFDDVAVRPLRHAVEARRLRWFAHPAMREELAHMLTHEDLARWAPDAAASLAHFDRLACVDPALSRPATAPGLRCRDADDQVFIDLAVACGARWLFTRDRALLALARAAQVHGVQVLTPARWAVTQA